MSYQPHDLSNLNLPGKYLSQLATDDISRRHFNGQKYISTTVSRLQFFLATQSKLSELTKFYAYQPLVKETSKLYHERKQRNMHFALAFSSLSIFSVYQLAKQNIVLPFLYKFGRFSNLHRLGRQYFWLAVLPIAFGFAENNYYFLNQVQKLWTVHAQRLNNKILSDPLGSQYPREILPISQVGAWTTPFIHKADRSRKLQNETHIGLAPDYAEVEQWQSVAIQSKDEGQGQGDAESVAEESSAIGQEEE